MNRFSNLGRFAVALVVLGAGGLAAEPIPQERAFRGHADVAVAPPVLHEDGYHLVLTAIGTGEATHMGRFQREETIVLDPVSFTFTGTITFTTLLGDELWVEVAGGFTGATTAVGSYTITGGTGRFTDASGEATFLAVVAADLSQAIVTFEGTIEY